MKKYNIIFLMFIIIIVLGLSFFVYSSIAKASTSDIRDKVVSEIQYFESKIVYMFNTLNGIEFENYNIKIEDISEKSKKSSKTSSSAGSDNDSSSNSDSSNESNSEDSSSANNSDSNSTESEINKTKKYSLNMKGILNSDKEINWNYIKKEAEILQASLSTLTLDLYEISLNNNDILNFNKEYDNLLLQIKNEDKESTLRELSILYSYFPKFIKNCNCDEQYEIALNTKLNIFNAYSFLDSGNWDTVNQYLLIATEKFSRLLTDIDLKNKNQSIINKCYISLNNLQNAINLKDKEIFLIKYRTLLEDLNSI